MEQTELQFAKNRSIHHVTSPSFHLVVINIAKFSEIVNYDLISIYSNPRRIE